MAAAAEQERRQLHHGPDGATEKGVQERTPGQNPSLCLPESPPLSDPLEEQVRIVTTPIATSMEENSRRLPQKRLLEQFSNCKESPAEDPKIKRSRSCPSHPQSSGAEAVASPKPAALAFYPGSCKQVSKAAAVSKDLEKKGDPEIGGRDTAAPSGVSESKKDDESAELSAYEKKRLKNIKENANFFASLELFQSAARLRGTATKGQSPRIRREKPAKEEMEATCRRSRRLQRVDPLGVPLPEAPAPIEESVRLPRRRDSLQPEDSSPCCVPSGPLEMIPLDPRQGTESTREFLDMWAKISQVKLNNSEKAAGNLARYKARLCSMALREDAVAKVVKSRIFSVAVHPSESRTLVAAGDKLGQIGLWDVDSSLSDGVYSFVAHSQPVSCMYFSPCDPAHLLSLSYDGTLRCGDITRAIFDEVYRNESYSLSSFQFLDNGASTLVVGMWDGELATVDRRIPGTSSQLLAHLESKIRTVHVHPVNRHYCMTAGGRDVDIYDVRHLKKSGSKPVVSLTGHTKSVASAYFSPLTGNRVVTVCADDTLRIFGTNCLSSLAPLLTTIRHNNNTGRWLTRFRAVWDPKQENCFVVGSMSRPRQIEAFSAAGELVHSFQCEDYLGSVCSINAWHPTRYIVVGGNSSGRIHVFSE